MSWSLITGGAKRLGASLCLALAAKGYDIVVHYNKSEQEAQNTVEKCLQMGVKADKIQGDFSTQASTEEFIDRYLQQFSSTSNLINNVGNYVVNPPSKTSVGDWYGLFQTNLHAPWLLTKALVPSIKKNKGTITNIGNAGLNKGIGDIHASAYMITKASLWLLTKSLACELAPDLVRVNMVSPGVLNNSVEKADFPELLPFKRTGFPEEVARVVTFLIDPKSNYITGQNIEVAGGVGL